MAGTICLKSNVQSDIPLIRPSPLKLTLDKFRDTLTNVTSVDKLVRVSVRQLKEGLEATCVAVGEYDHASEQLKNDTGQGVAPEQLAAAIHRRSVPGRRDLLALELPLDDRHSRILVLQRSTGFTAKDAELGRTILDVAGDQVELLRLQRERVVIERTYGQLLRRSRGNDLHYHILHAIRDLLDYDHSGSVFIFDAKPARFRLQAEQIAWKKGRSRIIGRNVDLKPYLTSFLATGNRPVLYFREDEGEAWQQDTIKDDDLVLPAPLPILDCHLLEEGRPLPRSAVVAPLTFEGKCVGVLALFGRWRHSLTTSWDGLLPLLPLAAIAIYNQFQDLGLEQAYFKEQRKHAVANVIRGVAHDINNALTVLLLRAQALGRDLQREEGVDDRYLEDIEWIEQYAGHCKRIFQNMLQFARRGAAPLTTVDLDRCLKKVIRLREKSFRAAEVTCDLRLDPNVPPIQGNQQQLEQVFDNLLHNAIQFSKTGERVVVALRQRGRLIRLRVFNREVIPKDVLPRVMEPFFSTRPEGHGLGLPLCRSIVVEHRGTLKVMSKAGTGTLVCVDFPPVLESRS